MVEFFEETLNYIKSIASQTPRVGIILGTGMAGFIKELSVTTEIPYSSIPHFPESTVESHSGKLIFGTVHNVEVVVMSGRFHAYEGYSLQQVTYPVRILKLLGIDTIIISNAAGSINLSYKKGDIVIIDDHINLQTGNPLIGKHHVDLGIRFPDMSEPYDSTLIHAAWKIAKEEKIPIHKGVYAAVNGPNLETRAEYKYLRIIGADVVGMSTVPEVIVARQLSLKVCALSLVTDECDPTNLMPVTLEEILNVAAKAEPLLTKIISRLVQEIGG